MIVPQATVYAVTFTLLSVIECSVDWTAFWDRLTLPSCFCVSCRIFNAAIWNEGTPLALLTRCIIYYSWLKFSSKGLSVENFYILIKRRCFYCLLKQNFRSTGKMWMGSGRYLAVGLAGCWSFCDTGKGSLENYCLHHFQIRHREEHPIFRRHPRIRI